MTALVGLILALQASAGANDSLANAFRDSTARAILARARAARLSQDSALTGYDARSYQRVAVSYGMGGVGRDRMLFGYESVGRVRWRLGSGAWVDIEGARTSGLTNDLTPPIPYYPGMEALWIKAGPIEEALEALVLEHPLVAGAEARYFYETGDSVTMRLSADLTVRIRELRVRPRAPIPQRIVGSFWFDAASGQLVRAAYRPSVALNVWLAMRDSPDSSSRESSRGVGAFLGKFFTNPASVGVSAIAVEYGLYEQRFWLPRSRFVEASGQANVFTGSIRVEQRFTYSSVNGRDSIPAIVVRSSTVNSDTLTGQAQVDAVAGLRPDSESECTRSDHYTVTSIKDGVAVAMSVPCNRSLLSRSPELPPSIFTMTSDAASKDRDALIASALSLGIQPPLFSNLPRPVFGYGLAWTRFNRVEGVSSGVQLDQQLGGGYTARVLGRFGTGDRRVNVEAGLTRSNLADSVEVHGYSRLAAANDWGQPFGLGASLAAALFGRDDGFYYRATGAEIAGGHDAIFGRGAHVTWRLFGERQEAAGVSVSRTLGGARFGPNIEAVEGSWFGGSVRLNRTTSLDPRHARFLTDTRLEGARGGGETSYGRASLDITASRPVSRIDGALTLAGGTSVGTLPPQRRWFVGGPHTVRGQAADTAQSGNAFWLVRAEVAPRGALRTTLFADFGWVGDRSRMRDVGRPMSGVGVGWSLFDGLVRLDFARGLYPRKGFRAELYMGARY